MKKTLGVIKSVITWLLLIFAVAIMLFTFISSSTLDKGNRSIFGYKGYIVLSDSMKATDFEAGDVVVVKEVDPSTLKEGDIITFVSKNSASYGETITHKIRRLTTTADGEPGFVTYGTTTNTDDLTVVDYFSVEGKYQFRLPKVGKFFNFLKTVPGYICCILIPFMLFIAIQAINTVKAFRGYKKEQASAIHSEREELAAEKKKTQEMMAELEALKAQISGGATSDQKSGDKDSRDEEDSDDGEEKEDNE
jgi:signal peptidase